MKGGIEFLFWLIVFIVVFVAWAINERLEKKKNPRSLWLQQFDERNS